jgi:hypothetical protein
MNPDRLRQLGHLQLWLLVGAGVGAMAIAWLAFFSPSALPAALRLALFACLAPALGSLLFALIHELTGGEWGDALRPFLAAGVRLAPRIWLLALPLIAFSGDWSSPAWPAYDSRGMLLARSVIYALIFFGLAGALLKPGRNPAVWVGPAGLILVVFALHLLAEDWLASLEPHWHSTAFPLVWMTGLAVAGLALAILAALACGISPRQKRESSDSLGVDWGNLLLAAVVFWCYVAFAQFLIIWAGNLPREIVWFEHRTRGAWALVPPVLAVIHFLLPLAVLLSRSFKRSPGMLAAVAATLLVAQGMYAAWMILPAFASKGLAAAALPALALVSAAALFAHRYIAMAVRNLKSS